MLISPSVAPFREWRVHVRVEDVSYADARSITVAEMVIPGISHNPDRDRAPTTVPFSVSLPLVESDHDYSVRAWIEQTPTPGKTIVSSDQVYPVLTRGRGTDVTVSLGTEQRPDRE